MCIRMIRYLTRFHCEKLRQCWKVKNAPATHTSHNVSQLSSLHATHYKKEKKKFYHSRVQGRSWHLQLPSFAQSESGRHWKYCLPSTCGRLATYNSILLQ